HYPSKGFLYDLYEKYHLEVRNSLLYENLKGKKEGIRIEYSATSFTKMGILTYSVVNDLLDEYDILLMDEVNAGLHVASQIELAILIYLLAKNHKIILTTHDLSFVDFILNFSRLIKNKDKIEKELNIHFPTFDKLPEVSLYLIQKGKLNYINPDSSAIPDYTEFYLNTI
ncbi:ABC transporter ATP-binding protein, partial [Acidianus ambivalens]|uniref:ATP-binding cassette domain-containing protein n=1 Tax=Acidianus ambivalens TaxID=2283 RepID=UPI001B85BE61